MLANTFANKHMNFDQVRAFSHIHIKAQASLASSACFPGAAFDLACIQTIPIAWRLYAAERLLYFLFNTRCFSTGAVSKALGNGTLCCACSPSNV